MQLWITVLCICCLKFVHCSNIRVKHPHAFSCEAKRSHTSKASIQDRNIVDILFAFALCMSVALSRLRGQQFLVRLSLSRQEMIFLLNFFSSFTVRQKLNNIFISSQDIFATHNLKLINNLDLWVATQHSIST